MREGLFERRHRCVRAEVAEEAEQEVRRDVQLLPARIEGGSDPGEHRLEGHASLGVNLRVEEDLGVDDVVLAGLQQIGPREVMKVRFPQEDSRTLVVDVQEGLQVAESISRASFLHRGVTQRNSVPLSQLEHELRFERALDVHVELGFRKPVYEVLHRPRR